MINRILSRIARLFVGTPAPLPRSVSEDAERDYGAPPDVPRDRDGRLRGPWFLGVVASVLMLGCGPTATERAQADFRRLVSGCVADFDQIVDTAPTREEGVRLLTERAATCRADVCAFCERNEIDCAEHGCGGEP